MEFYRRVFIEVLTAVSVISIISNAVIIFFVFKSKKLRKEKTNINITLIGLLQTVYLLYAPSILRLYFIKEDQDVQLYLACGIFETTFVFTIGICLLLVLSICDWYLKTYSEENYVKFCRAYKYVTGAIITIVILLIITLTVLCSVGAYVMMLFLVIPVVIVNLFYFVFCAFLIIMSVVHLVKRKRLENKKPLVGLVISYLFVGALLPIISLTLCLFFTFLDPSPELITLALSVAYLSPAFNMFYLLFCVDDFKTAVNDLFRSRKDRYRSRQSGDEAVFLSNVSRVETTD